MSFIIVVYDVKIYMLIKHVSLYGIHRIFLLQINEEGNDSRDAGEVKVVIGCGKFVLKQRSSKFRSVLIGLVVKEGSE